MKLVFWLLKFAAVFFPLLFSPAQSFAQFSGDYSPSSPSYVSGNTGSGDGVVNTSSAPTSVTITGSNNNGTFNNVTYFGFTAQKSGTYTFNWVYSTSDAPFTDPARFVYNGTTNLNGTIAPLTTPFGGQHQSGAASFSLLKDSKFSFQIDATDNCCGAGIVTISDFIYMILGPSVANTNQSLVNSSSILQGTVTLQNTVMVNSFTYDCPVFDKHGVCVSAGGRNTAVQAQAINNTSGLVIASYRFDKNNSRIGAYADQNLSVSGPGSVQLGNNTPMMGLFGVWSERPDDIGAEVKVSAAYGQKSTTVTRGAVGTGADASEPGSGGSNLTSQGAQAVVKYGFGAIQDVVVSPYLGIRYTQNNMGGYTEASSSLVTAPLTYGTLNTNATTALAGAEAKYRGIPQTTLFASAGVETDTNTANGSYNASNASIGTLVPVNFNPNPVRTRPTATIGAYYDIEKNQRLGVTGIYRQEPFQAVSTTTVMATYTIGL